MKKKLFALFFLSFVVHSFSGAQNTEGSLSVKVHLSGLPDGTPLNIVLGSTHKDEKPIASANLSGKEASFTLPSTGPRMYYLSVAAHYGVIAFMADKGDIVEIYSSVEIQKDNDNTFYSFKDKVIKGSKTNEEYNQKYLARKSVEHWFEAKISKYNDLQEQMSKAYASKDTVSLKQLRESPKSHEMEALQVEFNQKMGQVCDSTILANKSSWWGPFLLMDMLTYFTPEELPLFASFSAEAKQSFYGKLVSEELTPAVSEGQKIPVFSLTDSNNKKINALALFRNKKYILLDFWASWCVPCRKEIPNLKKDYAEFKEKGFEILSVSIDKNEADWTKAMKEENMLWLNFRDVDQSIASQFKVKAIPQTFLIDCTTGKMVVANPRGEGLTNKLRELLK